jgi:REP element-mobilizing transposase RayT
MTFYRRNLPHWHPPGQDIFLTWRLKGSLPAHLRELSSREEPGKRFLDLDRALDRADVGPLWLREPRVAECILQALHKAQNNHLAAVHAYAIMANHVHVLLTPSAPLPKIARLFKGATARQANLLLGFTGSHFWQDESFDHWVRNPAEWQKIRAYIERNPVAAGLARIPEEWPWSSASHPIQ